MRTLWQDVRYGARALLKSRGFTAVAVAALALGVGANTAIFSVVNAVLLRPLPYPEPSRLLTVNGVDTHDGTPFMEHSYPNFIDLREQNRSFEHVAAYSGANFFLTGSGEPERTPGAVVTADLFPLLGVQPELGRWFTPEEDRPGAPRTIILGHELWRRSFGADPNVVGREIKVGSFPATVVGVMPPGFKFPLTGSADCWMPLAPGIGPGALNGRDTVWLRMVARTKPGVTLAQAQADVSALWTRLAEQYPAENSNQALRLAPMHETLVGKVRTALLVLLGAVGFVLLIACANVANLLLARAASRRKEIAVRTALGATRWRIARQLLTESVMLGVAGGGAGLLLAAWGVELLVSFAPADIPRVAEVGLDSRVLLFTLGVSALTGVLFGLAPALQASKSDLNETLKEGGRGSTESGARGRVRSALVVTEIAVSLVLLVGAGLLAQSFVNLMNVKPGFEPAGVLAADVLTLNKSYPDAQSRAGFFRSVRERVAAVPGVESVGAVDPLPLGGNANVYNFRIEGRPPVAHQDEPVSDARSATPDYFRAMGIPLISGRAFDDRDTKDSPGVVVVNQSFARRFFENENPIGRRILMGEGEKEVAREVVGVVGDVRHAGLEEETTPEFYLAYTQLTPPRMSFVMRARGGADAASLAPAVREAIRQLDREQPVFNVRTMNQLLAESVARRRFQMTLLAVFASLALFLAAVGIYGVMSYTVAQRTHEIGVRVALGAQTRDVLRLVVGRGMRLALVGLLFGVGASLALTRLMTSLLFGVSAADPSVYAAVSLLLAGVALAACLVPARRATKVDPMEALRYE